MNSSYTVFIMYTAVGKLRSIPHETRIPTIAVYRFTKRKERYAANASREANEQQRYSVENTAFLIVLKC